MAIRRLCCGLVTGLAVAFAIAAAPSNALAKDGTVRVNAPGIDSREVTVRLADLGPPDINNQAYELSSGRKSISGYSIAKVLRAAASRSGGWLDLETLPSVEVDRPSGGPITLSRSQALGTSDRPPVFYETNGSTVFVMPGSPGREYTFRFVPVDVKVGSGEAYKIAVSPASSEVDQGDRVAFTARVSNLAAGDRPGYKWSVQGVTKASGPGSRFSWTFRREGTFSVSVTVSGKRESNTALASVTVGNPPNPPKPKDPPEASTTPQPFVPTPGGVPGAGGSGSGGGIPGGGGEPGAGEAFDFPTPAEPDVPEPESDLPLVSGELIGPDTEITEIEPGTEAGPTDQEADESGGFGLPGEAWTLFGVGLLVGLGGLIELRVFSRIG